MEITNKKRWPFILTVLWMALTLALGMWWLYLIVKLGHELQTLRAHMPGVSLGPNFVHMAKWEGLFFLVIMAFIFITFILLYLQDIKKNNSLQAFFASLTHELKTPLASIRLQSEVIQDILGAQTTPAVSTLLGRLLEDTGKLENELDKILQLSRVEREGNLNLAPVSIVHFIQKIALKYSEHLQLQLHLDCPQGSNVFVYADEFALSLILRNLFDNTLMHAKTPTANLQDKEKKQVEIKISIGSPPPRRKKSSVETAQIVQLHYDDHGMAFTGQRKKLGTLFYKYNSSKGSGIGLYLCKKLMLKMRGRLHFLFIPRLCFLLEFPYCEQEEVSGHGLT